MSETTPEIPPRKWSVWWLLLWTVVGLVVAGVLLVTLGIYQGSRGIRAARAAGGYVLAISPSVEWPPALVKVVPWQLPDLKWPEHDSHVVEINVRQVQGDAEAVHFLPRFSELTNLGLRSDLLRPSMNGLRDVHGLISATIEGAPLNLAGVEVMPHLLVLLLKGTTQGGNFEALAQLQELQTLWIFCEAPADPKLFDAAQQCPKMRFVGFGKKTAPPKPETWPAIAKLPTLSILMLENEQIADLPGISTLKTASKLRELDLGAVNSATLRELSQLTQVVCLRINSGRIQLADLDSLEHMTGLRELNVPQDWLELSDTEWAAVLPPETMEPNASSLEGPPRPHPSRLERLLKHRLTLCPAINIPR